MAATATTGTQTVRVPAAAASPEFYQGPLYRALTADPRVDLTVLFAPSDSIRPYDAGLGGRTVVWDVDPLSGYASRFLRAADRNEATTHFLGRRDLDVVKPILALWVHGYSNLTLGGRSREYTDRWPSGFAVEGIIQACEDAVGSRGPGRA